MGIKLKSFLFALDRPPVYRPGDLVTGYCIIELDGQMNLDQLHIKLEGLAQCSWTESYTTSTTDSEGNSVSSTETRTISSRDECLSLQYKPGNVYPAVLNSGQHRIEFNFQLPSILPSSFEGCHGNIRYRLRAKIHTPVFTFDKRNEITVTIKAPTYYSIYELTQGVKNSNFKMVGFFSSKTISMTCHLERIGHNLGTSFSVNCVIENNSKKSLAFRASLKQIITFIAGCDKNYSRETLCLANGSAIQPKCNQSESLSLTVPSISPVSLKVCPIIEIKYVIVVTLVIPGFHRDLHCELPVIITDEELTKSVDN